MNPEKPDLYYAAELNVPETPEGDEPPEAWDETQVVGKPLPRVDGYERVSGTAVFPSDVILPNMIFGAIVRCPHPHAVVRRIDSTEAERLTGVCAVITDSSPEANVEWPVTQWPYTAMDMTKRLLDPNCLYEGEPVAAVAAETPYQAQEAVRAVRVEYEVKPFVVDEQEALAPDAPKVHPGGNQTGRASYERGNVAQGFQEADVILEEHYRTEAELHTPMELHGCVANWDGDRLTIWESTQGVYAVQSRVAEVLGLPMSKVRVAGRYLGGGFGSKLQAGRYTIIAALLAKKTGRPVKLFLTREETYLTTGNRPPCNMRLKAGVRKDGTLTALDFSCTATGGAYPSGGTALVDWLVRDLYTCPNVRTETTDVYINGGPARPFRAPGHPQCSWALEQMLDALAEAIEMDPVLLRLNNIPGVSQGREGSPAYTTTGLRQCLERGSRVFGWHEARSKAVSEGRTGHLRRGVGMASCLWFAGGGGPPSTVVVKLFSDGSVNLNMGASDIGTGTKTVMAMVLGEELGIKPEMVQIEHADTGTTQYATPSGGSKTVPTEAPTVRAAAIRIKQQLLEMAAKDLETEPSRLQFTGGYVTSTDDDSKKVKVTHISRLKQRGVVVGVAHRGPNPDGKVVNPFAAQFCEVEVDMVTGAVRIVRFVGAHDSGRVMNRLTYDSQVFGGITMGIGLATTEMRVLDRKHTGKLVNKNWHDYKLPTAMDVPAEMNSVPVEMEDPEANITGAKGLGEPVTIPTAAAIANAVYHATGLRVTATPINPLQLCRLLAEQGRED